MLSFISHIEGFNLSYAQFALALLCASLYGFSKGGIKGLSALSVPLMAFIFGSKASTGIILPMLIIADSMAAPYYFKHVQWPLVIKLLPWAILGVLIGVWFGDGLDENLFRNALSIIVIISVVMLYWWELRDDRPIPSAWWFPIVMGFGAGFTTMVGNLAGAFITLFLFSMQLPKLRFIATMAWFFFVINLIKLPMHVFIWETITVQSLSMNLALLPAIIAGFIMAINLVKKIEEGSYRKLILILSFFAAIGLLMR